MPRLEWQWLRTAVRSQLGPVDALRRTPDWRELWRLGLHHGVLALVYRYLHARGLEQVPVPVRERLQRHYLTSAGRNAWLAGRLLDLLARLEADGVPALSWKGPVLAQSAYGDLALRPCNDLDILIDPEHVDRARALLSSWGYRPQFRLTPAQQAAHRRASGEMLFIDPRTGLLLDLHWQPAESRFARPMNSSGLWSRAASVPLAGGTVRTLASEDLLTALCIHGSAHLWDRLIWLCDVAVLVQGMQGVDWPRLLTAADAIGARRMVLLGLHLADTLLGARVSGPVARLGRLDPMVRRAAGTVVRRLATGQPGPVSPLRWWTFNLGLVASTADRLSAVFREALMPTALDRQHHALPGLMRPLYPVLRWFRVIRDRIQGPCAARPSPSAVR